MKTWIFVTMLASTAAMAADHQTINFEQLKLACKDPARFQNQNKPSSMKLECADRILRYVPAGTGELRLPTYRKVSHTLSSDKYTVPAVKEDIDAISTVGACPAYKQVEEIVTLSQDLTCAQIEDYKGTATQFCTTLIDGLRSENPAAVQVRETGKLVQFCEPQAPTNPGQQEPQAPAKPRPLPAPAPQKPKRNND